MDALVYEDGPLATYFEAQDATEIEPVPYDTPRDPITPPHSPFAPRGLPDLKIRLRKIRQRRNTVSHTSTEQLLERFRYVIVASELLSDETGPRTLLSHDNLSDLAIVSVAGAATTAALSFLAAWALHWFRTRRRVFKSASWIDVGIYSLGVLIVGVGVVVLGQYQYTRHIQKSTVNTLGQYVNESHAFDAVATSTIRFIQEVEVVARGYDLTASLPPVTRLEDRQAIRRCRSLRNELANTLRLLTTLLVESHNAIQPYVRPADLQRYHDIYEISLVEYSQAIELANDVSENPQDSLRELRFSARLHIIARRVLLCDLLALKESSGKERFRQWRHALRILREIEAETLSRTQSLTQALSIEEWGSQQQQRLSGSSTGVSTPSDAEGVTPESQHLKSQFRRFDDISHAIRALNAKMHILKEEVNGLTAVKTDDAVVSSALQKNYESIGTEIRSLMVDWERGRNMMLLNASMERSGTARNSRASSSIRSPSSPSSSLGAGLTIVDGGPAEALRMLNGDLDFHDLHSPLRRSPKGDVYDEEVFEAMSRPTPRGKRMSVSNMTRGEKIAKLQEDRKKRATLQEQADTTTSMLRELRMVIKHRPGASMGGASSNGTPLSSPTISEVEQQKRVTSL